MSVNKGRDDSKTYIGAYKNQLDEIALRNLHYGLNHKYTKIEVTIFCRRCERAIMPFDLIIHRGHGAVYHKKCWDELRT
jgi:hypothetical protein